MYFNLFLARLARAKVLLFYLSASILEEKIEKKLSALICTTNNGKIKEFKDKLLNVNFHTLKDENIFINIIEDGASFKENALIKLNTILEKFPYLRNKYDLILAEDSGLCVTALDGRPGVYSARYAGSHGDDTANNTLLLEKLKGEKNRSAYYEVCIALYYNNKTSVFSDIMRGAISKSEQGENGFGYDPLFVPEGFSKTLGELDSSVKLQLSHRSKALDQIMSFLSLTT